MGSRKQRTPRAKKPPQSEVATPAPTVPAVASGPAAPQTTPPLATPAVRPTALDLIARPFEILIAVLLMPFGTRSRTR